MHATLSGRGIVKSQCPTCLTPGWIKDLKPYRTIASLVHRISSLQALLQAPRAPPGQPAAAAGAAAPAPAPHSLGGDATSLPPPHGALQRLQGPASLLLTPAHPLQGCTLHEWLTRQLTAAPPAPPAANPAPPQHPSPQAPRSPSTTALDSLVEQALALLAPAGGPQQGAAGAGESSAALRALLESDLSAMHQVMEQLTARLHELEAQPHPGGGAAPHDQHLALQGAAQLQQLGAAPLLLPPPDPPQQEQPAGTAVPGAAAQEEGQAQAAAERAAPEQSPSSSPELPPSRRRRAGHRHGGYGAARSSITLTAHQPPLSSHPQGGVQLAAARPSFSLLSGGPHATPGCARRPLGEVDTRWRPPDGLAAPGGGPVSIFALGRAAAAAAAAAAVEREAQQQQGGGRASGAASVRGGGGEDGGGAAARLPTLPAAAAATHSGARRKRASGEQPRAAKHEEEEEEEQERRQRPRQQQQSQQRQPRDRGSGAAAAAATREHALSSSQAQHGVGAPSKPVRAASS